MKLDFRRPAQPRLLFTRSHIRAFMDLGTSDNLGRGGPPSFCQCVLEDIKVSKGSVCF
jgi:hypothetical protein